MTSDGLKIDPRYKYLEKYKFFSKSFVYGLYLCSIGAIVAVVRAIMFALMYLITSIMPPAFLFNVMIPFLKMMFCITINIKRKSNEQIQNDEIILSNHGCYKDFITIMTCLEIKNMNNITIPTKLLFPNTIKNLKFVEVSYKKSTTDIKEQLNTKGNILIFPEASFNDGTYVYKFAKHVFSLNRPIRPIALKITFCCDHYMRMHNASWFQQLYALFAIPYIHYDVYILDKMEIKNNETSVEFAERCRQQICKECGSEPIDYIFKDIKEII